MSGQRGWSLGLLGYPLGHSLSPRLHAAALTAMGLEGEYRLYPVPPDERREAGLAEILERVRRGEIDGLNVTVPHKTTVLPLLDALTPAAEAVGAVNTILRRDGRLTGDNTDASGFLVDVQRVFPSLAGADDPHHALVLGAGGSARAVVYALASAGRRVIVAARRVEQAESLAAGMNGYLADAAILPLAFNAECLAPVLAEVSLVVNTTPVGMLPDVEATPWPDGLPFPPRACVYDLIYAPPETRLVHTARQSGLPAANGLGMLIEQAALSLERWTARPVPREAMWAVAGRNIIPT